jgi:diaminopimelate decarboxylase
MKTDHKKYLDKAQEILNSRTPLMDQARLRSFVDYFLKERQTYLGAYDQYGAPLYLFDQEALIQKAGEFRDAFKQRLPQAHFFYALKSNSHPFLIRTLIGQGYGMDVSSGQELETALTCQSGPMIFSGPGKTADELDLACGHAGRVTVLLDSFTELRRLEEAAARKGTRVKAGVRLMIEENGLWRKFGIPLKDLSEFFHQADQCSYVELRGLQFHASWNLDAGKQTAFLVRLGKTLAAMDKGVRQRVRFVDIGGGYWPSQGEWMQPSATPEGRLKQCLDPRLVEGMDHRYAPALPIEQFADQVVAALTQNLFNHVDCDIYLEPGRWVSHEAMHILLTVVDKKADDVVITDGGTNIVGWDRYETDYFPVINLSRPAPEEKPCMVFGSLCTPHDLWGYSYWGEGIEAGDILLVPTQGAYTYSLRQEFIKPLPRQVVLTRAGSYLWDDAQNPSDTARREAAEAPGK